MKMILRAASAAFLLFASLPPAFAVSTTPTLVDSAGWSDLGAGPIMVQTLGDSAQVAISDTMPTDKTFILYSAIGNVPTVFNTTSHVWARALNNPATVVVAPISAGSGGGGGGGGSVTQGTSPWVENLAQWSGTAVGAPTTYGTAPTGNAPGVNAFVTNNVAVSWATAQPINNAQLNGSTIATGSGASNAGTQRFILATDNPTLTVSGSVSVSNFPATQAVSWSGQSVAATQSGAWNTNLYVAGAANASGNPAFVSVTNFPTTQGVNNAQINGVAIATGTGASNTGTQRVIVSTDSAIGISGSLPAFATTPTFNVGTTGGLGLDTSLQSIKTALGSPFQAGGNIGNTSFGISGTLPAYAAIPTFKVDQTTPGTTNRVSIGTDGSVAVSNFPASQAVSGTVTANQGAAGASAWKVDGSAVTQPVSGTVNANLYIGGTANASGNPIFAQITGGTVTANVGTTNGLGLDTSLQQIKTTLGTPFQANGSIGNTAFGILYGGNPVSSANALPVAVTANAADTRVQGGTLSTTTVGNSIVVPIVNGQASLGMNFTGLTASGAVLGFTTANDNGTNYATINGTNCGTGVPVPTLAVDGSPRFETAGHTFIKITVTTAGTGSIGYSYSASTATLSCPNSPLAPGANLIGGMNSPTAASGKITKNEVAIAASTSTQIAPANAARVALVIQCPTGGGQIDETGGTLTSATTGGTLVIPTSQANNPYIPPATTLTAITAYTATAQSCKVTEYSR